MKIFQKSCLAHYYVFCLLVGISVLFTQCAHAAQQVLMPQGKWLVNTWQGTTAADISYEDAPDASQAIRLKFSSDNKKMANVIMPKNYVATAAPKWPSTFKGFYTYVWNDGENRTISIAFITKETVDGKQQRLSFKSFLKVDHKGWKLVKQTQATDFQNRQASLIPSNITSVFISVDRPAEIALGALTWVGEGEVLRRLDEGSAATIFKTAAPPVIDGDGGDAAWKDAREITLSHVLKSNQTPENKTTVKVLYDNENLYLLAVAPFSDRKRMKLNATTFDASVYEDECIEVILYPGIDSRKYGQFIINPNGVKADLGELFDQVADGIRLRFKDWNPKWEGAAKIGESSWTAEYSIPWKAVDDSKQPPLMKLQVGRNDTTAGEYALWASSPTKPASGFGIVALNELHTEETITIPRLTLQRDQDNTYIFSGTVLANHDLQGLTIKTYFCPPRSETEVYTKTFSTTGKSATIDFSIDTERILNGKYFAAIEFIPGNKKLYPKAEAFFFNQLLPSAVKFSDVIFNPVPKELSWHDGAFVPATSDVIGVGSKATERTVKTAKYLAEKWNGVYGIRPEVQNSSKGRLRLSIDKAHVNNKTGSDSSEAYTLDVTPEHISIVGADETGLYYGVRTLIQLMHGPKKPDAPIRSLRIADWPSYSKRVVTTMLQFHFKKDNGTNGGLQLDRYKDWIERVVAGNKYNTLILTWADQINYPSVPEVHNKNNFSPEEIAELFDFAREHFIEASPGINFGAHSVTWRAHFPELMEPGWKNSQLDVTLPETLSLMERLFGDLMDIAGEESHYFMNNNDEWWHSSKTKENFVYKGKTRQELMYNYLTKVHQFVSSRGKQMVMFSDMLLPKHNGGPPWNLSEITERLPKDIVMATWSPYSNDFLAEKGFKETWTVNNGFKGNSQRPSSADSGYGQTFYCLFQSLFDHTAQGRGLAYSYLSSLPAANYAWNKELKGVLPTQDVILQKMPAYLGSFSYKANPAAGDTLTPITIPGNETIPEWNHIKNLTSAGEIPLKAGVALTAPESSMKVSLPVGTKASSFYILSAVYPEDKWSIDKLQDAYLKDRRSRPYGLIVGQYRINYTDGTHAEYNIRLGRSISLFQYTPAAMRYGQELRVVVPLTENQEKALTQYEMINPHPEKAVESFEVTGNYDYAPILVAGLTMRGVR